MVFADVNHNGHATRAMVAERENNPAGAGTIDGISQGTISVEIDDLVNAVKVALEWFQTHPIIGLRQYLSQTSGLINTFCWNHYDELHTWSRNDLLALFRDLCTAIEKIMKAVDSRSNEGPNAANDKVQILGQNQSPQNLTPVWRETHFRNRRWHE